MNKIRKKMMEQSSRFIFAAFAEVTYLHQMGREGTHRRLGHLVVEGKLQEHTLRLI